jgi:hypothetical protein
MIASVRVVKCLVFSSLYCVPPPPPVLERVPKPVAQIRVLLKASLSVLGKLHIYLCSMIESTSSSLEVTLPVILPSIPQSQLEVRSEREAPNKLFIRKLFDQSQVNSELLLLSER